MRHYLSLLSPLLIVGFMLISAVVNAAIAQTLTAEVVPPAPQAAWEIMIKALFPVLLTALSPYLQGWITSGFAKVHPTVQYAISTTLGVVMGALASEIPGVPLSMESAANIGAGAGATGQFLSNQSRASMHPKTDAAKCEMAKMEQDQPGSSV